MKRQDASSWQTANKCAGFMAASATNSFDWLNLPRPFEAWASYREAVSFNAPGKTGPQAGQLTNCPVSVNGPGGQEGGNAG